MLDLFRLVKFGLAILAAAAMLAGAPSLSHAATGSVLFTITRVGFFIGGGSGTLHFHGKRYLLRVDGVSVSPFGTTRVSLVGRAYYMRTAGSIHGVYSAVLADAAVESTPTIIRLRNGNGVVLELRGQQSAVRGRRGAVRGRPITVTSVDLSGMEISLR